jgi:hypothetical protein
VVSFAENLIMTLMGAAMAVDAVAPRLLWSGLP